MAAVRCLRTPRWILARAALVGALLLLAGPTAGPLSALGSPARAQDAGARAALRFCFTVWPPYTSLDPDTQAPGGLSVDVMREVARRQDAGASFTALPWARCLTEVEAGLFDGALDGAAGRTAFPHGAVSYVTAYYGFWVRADSPLHHFSGLASFAGRPVSLIHGWWYPPSLTRDPGPGLPGLVLEDLPSAQSQIAALRLGRQEAAFGELVSMRFAVRAEGADIRPLTPVLETVPLYVLLNPHAGRLSAGIDKALAAMRADGSLDKLYQKHIGLTPDALRAMAQHPAPDGDANLGGAAAALPRPPGTPPTTPH